MTIPASSLLASAEDWARNVLLDADKHDPSIDPIRGWWVAGCDLGGDQGGGFERAAGMVRVG